MDDSPAVELLEAGEQPRRALRFDASVGAREEWLMTAENTVERLDGAPVYGAAPPATYVVDLVVEHVAEHERRLDVLVGAMPSSDGVRVFARGQLVVDGRRRTLDASMEFVTSKPDGSLVPIELDSSTQFQTRVVAELHRFLIPLPAQAVGKGAVWETVEHVEQDGIEITITSTYELTALMPDGADINATVTSEVKGDTIDGAERGPVKVARLEIAGERRGRLATTRALLGQQGSIVTEMELGAGEDRVGVRMTERVHLQLLEQAQFAIVPADAAAFVTTSSASTVDFCKSLRGDRDGRFPRASGPAALVGECSKGKAVGTWTAFHDDGKHERLRGQFEAGVPVGRWTQRDAKGKELGSFDLDGGNGTVVEWWPDGQKRLEVGLRGGKPHGSLATWHPDGKPDVRGRFHKGRRDGVWELLDAEGKAVDTSLNDGGCRLVMSVAPNSAADRAGMRVGDVVTAIDAKPVEDVDELRARLGESGDRKLAIVVMREGKRTTIHVTPDGGSLGIRTGCSVHVIEVPEQ